MDQVMNTLAFDRQPAAPARASTGRMADDKTMLRTAAELTRDLIAPRAAIYWSDLIASAVLGYGALVLAVTTASTALAVVAAIVSALALYRGISFIHELTHMKHANLPHFRTGWNVLIGVPMLTPSFMYEGVHNLHHAKTRYGTSEDPEYLPLALMKPWTLPVFILVSALAPIGLLIRFGVLSPLTVLFPGLRRAVVQRYSALAINPGFRRRLPEGTDARRWMQLETAGSLWAITLIALVVTGTIPLHAFVIGLAVFSGVAVVNQVRTLVAHLWENDGEAMSVTAQYLDSVTVPPPAYLPMLWAPVGLRYHALHHLLPSLPYHSLGEAHRRLSATLDPASPFHQASYKSATGLMLRIARSTVARGR
jgi:fatty acid desaturase